MSTYRKLHGQSIQAVTTDPPSSVSEGQIWYNTNSQTFKSTINAAAWSTGGNLSTARRALWGSGSQTAALAFGGYAATKSNATEEYGGSSWTNGGSLSTARYHLAGTGTQTASFACGGNTAPPPTTNATEEYDGSSWSGGGNLGTARYVISSFGILTAGVAFGGAPGGGNSTEEYDGSSWTGGGNYPESKSGQGGCGILTAGLGVGGGPDTSLTCEYNGTAWTAVNPAAYDVNNGWASGTQTAAILSGGSPETNRPKTQTYDGTTWATSAATLSVGSYSPGGSSTSRTASLAFGGGVPGSPANTNRTEEFDQSASVKTLTQS